MFFIKHKIETYLTKQETLTQHFETFILYEFYQHILIIFYKCI